MRAGVRGASAIARRASRSIESSLWALDVLIEEGYIYDASIFPIHHDRYGIPDAPRHAHTCLQRAGRLDRGSAGSTVRLGGVNLPIAGGGYFRLLPYAWTQLGHRPRQPRRAAAGGVLHASVGDRSGPAADAGRRAPPACAITAASNAPPIVWRGCFATSASTR